MVAKLDTPGHSERADRLDAVLTVVYLLFNEGYSATGGDVQIRHALCDQAIRLARLLSGLFPAETEAMGLLALCLLQHSRANARLDADGGLVALEDQDRSAWDDAMIAEGRAPGREGARAGGGARPARPAQAGAGSLPPISRRARLDARAAR